MKQFGKVAVLMGGKSQERAVSLKSGEAILNALVVAGVDAFAFDPSERPLADLLAAKVDRAFIALHGRGGEDGTIQGALEFLGIPYTGSKVLGSALAMDKGRCKHLFSAMNLATAPYHLVSRGDEVDCSAIIAEFGKVMVKPVLEGSSIGMNSAATAQELDAALTTAFEYDNVILVEKWITGRDLTVAILGDTALPVVEMQTPNGFYDYHAKYEANTTIYTCPAMVDDAQREAIQAMALSAFKLVGASGWGRVDIMLGDDGSLNLLEVNTVPGMTEKSLVPMAANAAGKDFSQLVIGILEQTL